MSDIKKIYPVDYKFRDEKLKVINRYILGKTSGEGSYGKVKEGIDSKKKRRVALKILSRKFLRRATGGEASIEREISILSSLNHKNIIRLYNSFVEEENQKIYIVLEFAGGGNLQNFLERIPDKKLPMPQARKYFHDLISGLLYLKQEKILHRDIKPDNLLLTIDGDLKISDFGIAEQCEPKDDKTNLGESPGIGSPAYQAPELISSPPSSIGNMYKTDVWSAGIVLYIMLVGEYPFPTQNNLMQLFEDITEGRYKIPDWLDENAKDLLKKMLQINPDERIDVSEILDHPWMTMEEKEKIPFIPITPLPTLFGGYDKQATIQTIKKMKNALKREMMRKMSEEEDEEDGEASDEPSSSEGSQSVSSLSSSSASTSSSKQRNRCIIL